MKIFGMCMISFLIVGAKERYGKGEIVYETIRND